MVFTPSLKLRKMRISVNNIELQSDMQEDYFVREPDFGKNNVWTIYFERCFELWAIRVNIRGVYL